MLTISNFQEANKVLSKYISVSTKPKSYSLHRMVALMEYLGNPQDNLRVIHVAGTSGKTSTCYYIASLLKESGYSTGLTVSPHIDEVNERVQINLVPLSEQAFCKQLSEFIERVEASDIRPSYFEILMAFAYWVFDKNKVEFAVVEVGLGGLLDASNVVTRQDKVCVITDIGYDHTRILGKTLDQIAGQKAGIIQANNVVFMNQQSQPIQDVVREVCERKSADLNIINIELDVAEYKLSEFQNRNLSLAHAVCSCVLQQTLISKEVVRRASQIVVPGRMEEFGFQNQKLIIDGSHNEQKITALARAVKSKYPEKSVCLLISFGSNKESSVKPSLKILKTLSGHCIVTNFTQSQDEPYRPITAQNLGKMCEEAGFGDVTVCDHPIDAFTLLCERSEDVLLVTGSNYLLGDIRPRIPVLAKQGKEVR